MKGKGFALLLAVAILLAFAGSAVAAPVPIPNLDINISQSSEPQQVVDALRILVILTVLTLVPAILVMMTSFTRIVIVLSFIRNALATQQIPPNQVLIGLALFLTFFTMMPTYQVVKANAIDPYLAEEISQEQAMETAAKPLRKFMLAQTREKDLALFLNAAGQDKPLTRDSVALSALIPAFVISELKTAFQMGFMIFIPFLIIDMVVASILMSMGMFMLPPVMISLPFKLLLFVMVDGWYLLVKSLLQSF